MPQQGEGCHEPPKPPEPNKKEKKPLTIRISMFFDGTGNNRGNINARKNKEEVYQTLTDAKGNIGSYENDFSNISILEEVYKSAGCLDKSVSFYIEGVGTRDFEETKDKFETAQKNLIKKQAKSGHEGRSARNRKAKAEEDSNYGNVAGIGSTGINKKTQSGFQKS